jgi:hypothetical protein
MIARSQQVEFDNVEVVRETTVILMCRIGTRTVAVPALRMLPGTTVARLGDRGRLILPREVALNLGLEREHGESASR